jgi:hypothetical protein
MSDTTEDMQHYDPEEWQNQQPPENALATRPEMPPPSTMVDATPITPEQAKVNAVAELTMKAYSKASELKLTPEEIAALEADFPDEAFRTGASGKADLIYIEHAALRERLNRVIGNGQWAIIPRKRWGEDFTIPATRDKAAVEACRIYVEAMLMIRGCFVAEAVGDMVYYKNNQTQNYGDAVEGAKTAALRRCAKEVGIGLQAWKKSWCDGWLARNRGGGQRPPQNAPGRSGGSQSSAPRPAAAPAPQPAPRPAATTAQVATPQPPQEADRDQRFRFLSSLSSQRDLVTEYLVKKGWIQPGQNLEDLPNKYVPTIKSQYDSFVAEFQAYVDTPADQRSEPEWRTYKLPWGRFMGDEMAKVDKKWLFGMFMNFDVETTYDGKPKKPETIAIDEKLRTMLDAAGEHYGWQRESKND